MSSVSRRATTVRNRCRMTEPPITSRRRCVTLLAVAIVACAASVFAADDPPTKFSFPAELRTPVEFWKKIFGVYSENQILVHDSENLGRVYSVLDFRERADAGESRITLENAKRRAGEAEKERIRALLRRLDARDGNDGGLDPEEQRIWNLFAKDGDRHKFADAAAENRLRTQPGLKERFAQGVRISRRYLAEMEEIFRREGLPPELTRLPLVESCFNIDAYSKVGAAGIWQFMRSTGRSYMAIGGVVDERRDPLRATRGAARHLRDNYEVLGSWPLAITAYNHGRAGMVRAVEVTGTDDIGRIIRTYHGPLFGFASRNFYAEFLAALAVEGSHREYFGDMRFDPPFRSDEILMRQALSGSAAASCAKATPDELAELNPAIDSAVFRGAGNLPRGYLLRVPPGSAGSFEQRLAQIASDARVVALTKSRRSSHGQRVASRRAGKAGVRTATTSKASVQSAGAKSYRTHRVRDGQTLSHIADRYGVSVQRLKHANRLRGSVVKQGQVLKIPTG